MANHSSLIRYVAYNLRMLNDMTRLISRMTTSPAYNANIDVNIVKSLNRGIQKATDYVLSTMKRENTGMPVVFLMGPPPEKLDQPKLE